MALPRRHSHLHMRQLRGALSALRGNLPLKETLLSRNFTHPRGDCSPAPGAGRLAPIGSRPERGAGVVAMLLAMTFLFTACLPLNSIPPTETPLPSETAVPTQTIVWFPPSATPTLLTVPTYTATPDMNPGIGVVTLSDNFTNKTLWDTAVSNQGSAAISNKRLSLAVQPGIYLTSLRHDLTLSDFYAEITARPSLCREDDSYGILVRSTGLSFYRFILTCNGQISAERISNSVKLQIQAPVASGDAPRPPAEVRIGLWAVAGEMRLFLNGRFQFSILEKTFPSGAFGVFARSAGEDLVSVTFSDFKVYEVDYVPPTATPLP